MSTVYNLPDAATSDTSISTLDSAPSSSPPHPDHPRTESFATSTSDDNTLDHDFHPDATSSILDSLQRGDSPDVIALELMGLRMSANASDHQVRHAVVAAFLQRIANLMDTDDGSMGASDAVQTVFARYKDLAERTVFDKAKEAKADQVDFLLLMQRALVSRRKGETVLLFAVKELYDLEVVQEEGVVQWWGDGRSWEAGEMCRVRGRTGQFVEWLREADEDSGEEEEEDDDDDGDED